MARITCRIQQVRAMVLGLAVLYAAITMAADGADGRPDIQSLLSTANSLSESSPDSALILGKQALTLAKESESGRYIAESYYQIGMAWYNQSEFPNAISSLKQAVNSFGETTPDSMRGRTLNLLAKSYHSNGERGQAIETYHRALPFYGRTFPPGEQAKLLNNIGYANWQTGQLDSALVYFRKALEIRQTLDDPYRLGLSLNNVGVVYYDWGLYDEALDFYYRALEYRRKAGDKRGQALTLSNIGRTYIDWGRSEKAGEFFRQALEIGEGLADYQVIGYAHVNLGSVAEKAGDYQSALDQYEAARTSYSNDDLIGGETLALLHIGHVRILTGDLQGAEQALTRALTLAQQTNSAEFEARAMLNLGKLHVEKGAPDRAENAFLESAAISREINLRDILRKNYAQLARLYRDTGDYPGAYKYLEQTMALKDSLFGEKQSKSIAALQVQFETARQEKENAILRKEREIQDVRDKRKNLMLGFGGVLLMIILGFVYLLFRKNDQLAAQNIEISRQHDALEMTNSELRETIAQVKLLQGLLPICANCKKIRNDKGYWQEVESYITDHSDAVFSHGICPECMHHLYPQYSNKEDDSE